jgi:hypothetical protein
MDRYLGTNCKLKLATSSHLNRDANRGPPRPQADTQPTELCHFCGCLAPSVKALIYPSLTIFFNLDPFKKDLVTGVISQLKLSQKQLELQQM